MTTPNVPRTESGPRLSVSAAGDAVHLFFFPDAGTEETWFYELFRFDETEERGWVVLGWTPDGDDPEHGYSCTENFQFGGDRAAAFARFAEVVEREGGKDVLAALGELAK